MPYISPGLREELLTEPERAAKDFGAMNYLFTQAILKVWNANPCYTTIHQLAGNAGFFKELQDVCGLLDKNGVAESTRNTAYDLAFTEAYRRVFSHYENEKLQLNGDLPGYEEALKTLNEMARKRFEAKIGIKEES